MPVVRKIEELFTRLFVTSGGIMLLFIAGIKEIRSIGRNIDKILRQMLEAGFNSLPLASLIGLFTGMIVALESGLELKQLGLENVVANIVAFSIVREMGPVITAMISAGRVGAAMAAELGTMTVNEEIDALRSMGINPVRFLVMPRFVASVLMQPILTMYAILIGIYGASIISLSMLNIAPTQFINHVYRALEISDISFGLGKTLVFAAMYSIISCYMGLTTRRGAEGVGRSTTQAVVVSLTMIIIADYFFGRFFG